MLTQTAVRTASSTQPTRAHLPPAAVRSVGGTLDMMGAQMSFSRNAEIYGQGEAADYIYRVVSGAARTSKVLNDGRRQLGGFYLPGDMFGLEPGDEHTFSAEAIADSKVLVIKRAAVLARAQRDSSLARELWTLTAQQLRRSQDHVMLLIKSAHERVAAFLLEMAERLADGSAVELPMSRQDIADYLGLTIETVSRTLTHMENLATIEVASRRIVLRNRTALARLNA
jgi:CRP/FNR family transcriptional regulator, nitrogen fixation regulation protein